MSIYIWLVILILFFALILRGNQRGSIAFIILAFLLMFGIQGLRDSKTIGNDSRTSYRYEFNSMGDKDWKDLGGIGDWASLRSEGNNPTGRDRNFAHRWLMKIVYELTGGDYQWFLVIVALIILSSEALFVYRFSPSPIQSVLYYLGLLFFVFHMSATKQSIAMSILLFSFPAIIEKRPIVFISLVVFASFFHMPALIFLPAYWIGNMKLGRNYLIMLAVVFAATFVLRGQLLSLLSGAYYDSEVETAGTGRFLANKVIIMLAIVLAALIIRPPHPDDKEYCALLQLMGVAALIQTFASYNNIFERLADYYFQFSVIFIPMVFEKIRPKRRFLTMDSLNLINTFAPLVFCSFAIWRFLDNIMNDVHFSPFRFFFQ